MQEDVGQSTHESNAMSCCQFEGLEESYYVEFLLLFDESALFVLVVWSYD